MISECLLDNWILELSASCYNEKSIASLDEDSIINFCEVLNTIAFSKHIRFNNDIYSIGWRKNENFYKTISEVIKPVTVDSSINYYDDDTFRTYERAANYLECRREGYIKNSISMARAIEYLYYAQYYGYNYIPVSYRRLFFAELYRSKTWHAIVHNIMNSPTNRIDENSVDFIDKIYKELNIENISLKIPLIPSYIYSHTQDTKEMLEFAIKLSETKKMKEYRQWLGDLQASLSKHDIFDAKQRLSLVKDVEESLEKEFGSKKMNVSVSLTMWPSFNLDFEIPNRKNKIVFTFIKDMYKAKLSNPLIVE